MLTCSDVSFDFPGQSLLRHVDLSLAPGELSVLLGHNGSGKSTLCRLMAGLYLPLSGEVSVDGFGTASPSEEEVRRRVQIVTQDAGAQIIGDTVEEDIALSLRNFGEEGGSLRRRVNWALEAFGVEHLRFRRVETLSGGEQQLVRLAGAIAVRPRYLLLDEAISMLDGSRKRAVLDRLRQLASEQRVGILLTSHDLEDLAWADTACWLAETTVATYRPAESVTPALAARIDKPFNVPLVTRTAIELREGGWQIPLAVRAQELVEGVCRSSS